MHSLQVIRVGDWKLLEEDGAFAKGNKSSPQQLYNIAEDPYETTNLASSETAKVAELGERLTYHRPFARDAQPGASIPGLDERLSPLADDRPVMFGEEENTAYGAEVETALTQREAGNLGPKLLWIDTSGDQVRIVYDETLDADSVPPADAFKVVVNPGYTSAEVTGVEVGESEVLLTLAQSVRSGETAGLTYEVPETGAIRDVDGIAAVGVTWVTITSVSHDATLSALSLSGIDIGTFDGATLAYEAIIAHNISTTRVAATATDATASVVIADAQGNTSGSSREVSLAVGTNVITVRVTAADGVTTRAYTVTVERPPSWEGFALPTDGAAGDLYPSGLWSDGTALWIADLQSARVFAFAMADKARLPGRDIATAARQPAGLWSDGTTLRVADYGGGKLYAYRAADGAPAPAQDIELARDNAHPSGLWSDGDTLWVADYGARRVFAYGLAAGERRAAADLETAAAVKRPWGLWSDGDTLWVADWTGGAVRAYGLADGARRAHLDLDTAAHGNANPMGLYSDGDLLWVSDSISRRVVAYSVPGLRSVSVTAASASVVEGTAAVFTLARTGATDEALEVSAAVTETGSMLAPPLPATVRFEAGSRTAALSLATVGDTVVEPASVVAATLTAGSGYAVARPETAEVTVTDDDVAAFSVAASPVSLAEGDRSTVTVAAAGVTFATAQSIELSVVAGTAAADDYGLAPGTLTLAPGAATVAATLTAVDDALLELAETVTVAAVHDGVEVGRATVTIRASDSPDDATLSAFALSGVDIGPFAAETTSYAARVAHAVTGTTATATPNHPGAGVVIADADGSTAGTARTVALAVGTNVITATVTAADGVTTRTYSVAVARSGSDIDTLAAGNSAPRGLWGNGEVLWVTDYLDSKLYAYARADGGRLPARDVDTFSGARYPTDAWSDGETLWVSDNEFRSAYAYRLADGVRLADRDIALAAANRKPTGVWGDGETLWVLDAADRHAYAYRLADGTRAADREFALAQPVGAARLSPWGLWSDGDVFHVVSWPVSADSPGTSDPTAYAYRDGARAPEADVGDLVNQRASGLWSDGVTLWVSEHLGTAKLYAYALPALSSHAALVLLRLAEADLGAFSAAATSYAATVPHSTTRVTLTAHGAAGTAVAYTAADADPAMAGHQADLAVGANAIDVVVTAADGTTTRTYTVTVTRAIAVSADATLAALSLSGIDLGAFAAATTDYSVDVDSTVGATTVTATANHAGATVVIADAAGSTPGGTRTVVLAEGATAITVRVTAEDGATTATYTVTVTRAAVVPLTAAFEDVPAGHDGTSVFTLTLRFSDALAVGSATTLRDGAVAVGNGTLSSVRRVNGDRALWTLEVAPSGTTDVTMSLSADVACDAGGVCTADGRRLSAVARTTVPATRAPSASDDATLASLALSDIDIGTFVPATTSYAAAVAHAVSSTTVTATPNDAAADVTIAAGNGSTSGTSRSANLAVGTNTLTVTVTAGDGQTQRSYTVTVTRAAAPLTATFEDVPASHDGALAFSFTLRFSEPIQTSFRTLRDENLGVTGGTATRARRVDGSVEWSIEVQPTGSDDVTVWLTADVACAAGGVCTLDGRRLSNAPSVTVPGPASAAPPLSTATVSGTQLTLRYGASLDGGSTPAPADFVVLAVVAEAASQVRVASVRVVDDTALLTLARPVLPAETVTLSYLEAPMHPLQDVRGRAAAPLTDVAVRNETAARVAAAVPGAAKAAALSARAGVLAPPPDLSGWLADGGASAPFGRLDLSARALPEVATLAGLTELRVLNLAGTGIADLTPLSGLTGLEVLDLSSNAITDVGPLSRLTGLERLDLSGNRIADLAPLSGLTGLTVLLLDGNEVVDVVSLSVLTELLHLGLSDNRIAEVGLLAELGSLKRLDLGGNRVSDVSPLGDLSQLVWLRLPGNPVSDTAPLGRLTLLRWLWLDASVEGRGPLDAAARRSAAPLWLGVGAPREREAER